MVKEPVEIKFTETEDGFRIDVKGKDLKDACACCMPMFGGGREGMKDCCSPAKEDEK